MKKIFLFVLVAFAFTSCNFDFIFSTDDDNGGGGEPGIPITYTFSEDNTRRDAFQGEEHLWYEIREFDADGNIIFLQRFTPNDTLLYSYAYVYEEGFLILMAYYNHLDELQFFESYSYEEELLTLTSYYGGDFSLQSFESTMYDGDQNELQYARFNYLDEVVSARWRVVDVDLFVNVVAIASYSGPGAENDPTRESPTPMVGTFNESHNSLGIPVPIAPTPPEVPNIAFLDPGSFGLSLTTLSVSETDDFGTSSAQFANRSGEAFPGWDTLLPTSVSRSFSDSTLRTIRVELGYNQENQLISKSSYYGDDLGLELLFTYNDHGWVNRLDTQGEAMLLPVTYEMDYYGDTNIPLQLSISLTDVLLQYIVFEYEEQDGDITIPVGENVPELEGLVDPIVFSEGLFKIHQFFVDDVYQGSYVFDWDYDGTGSLRIETVQYDDLDVDSIQDNPDSDFPTFDYDRTLFTSGGYFLLNLDPEGLAVSFGSYDATDELLWEYGYDFAVLGEQLTEIRTNAEDSIEMVENIDTADPLAVFEEILRMFF